MSKRYPVIWAGEPLSSGLTQAQVARLLGVRPSVISERITAGTLPVSLILGTKMITVAELVAQGLLVVDSERILPSR